MTVPEKILTLNNGKKMPIFGLGTWQSGPGEVGNAIKEAIKAGYRHIDGALIYGNEKEIGVSLQEIFKSGEVKREDLFLTSKLWNNFHRPELVLESFNQTLKDLQVEYVDLYMMHWPVAQAPLEEQYNAVFENIPIIDTWREMEKIYKSGKAKAIGVCNFPIHLLEDLISKAEIIPAVNQVELHPYLPQQKLVDFCHQHNIQVTAYSPLGTRTNPSVLNDSVITEVAKKYNKSPAQVVLSWNVQRGVIVIPKSTHKARLLENMSFFTLAQEDMDKINKITTRARACYPERFKVLNIFTDFADN